MKQEIIGNIVDIPGKTIQKGSIVIENGQIVSIKIIDFIEQGLPFILPGFVDSHVHIESSLLVPAEFARLAVVHGTVATVSDPHEIANVCGLDGVEYMVNNGNTVPFKFNFGAPSCVPATLFETAGASIDAEQIDSLLSRNEIKYLSEMMNFPAVLSKDEEVIKKISCAKKYNKPVDGHAPGLRGDLAKQYIDAGISTDHECFTAEEALDKLNLGMKILIREGSAAKNFEALADLIHDHAENMMFCSDDKHPDGLLLGHINQLCARAVARGIDLFKVLTVACINPVKHYKLDVGLLKENDPADFILIQDLKSFEVLETYIDGICVAKNGKPLFKGPEASIINNFNCKPIKPEDLLVLATPGKEMVAIEAIDGQLISNKFQFKTKTNGPHAVQDTENDLLKIVVVNRYHSAPLAIAFIKNIGLKQGAIASSVAHDSHNIVAVGVDDTNLAKAINMVIKSQGGLSAVSDTIEKILPLPVAGLMSACDGFEVASSYSEIDNLVKNTLGSTLSAPFMTLSFMALLVIPHIKLSDKGLFDADKFCFY